MLIMVFETIVIYSVMKNIIIIAIYRDLLLQLLYYLRIENLYILLPPILVQNISVKYT